MKGTSRSMHSKSARRMGRVPEAKERSDTWERPEATHTKATKEWLRQRTLHLMKMRREKREEKNQCK